eukprot:g22414.t1
MVLCIFSNWIARIPQVWEGCVVGASLSVLHASFCSEPGPSRNELFQQVVDGVSLQGWSGQSVQVDWPIFDLVGAHAAVLSSGLWEGRGDQCSKLEPGDDDLGKASLITMHHALRASMITALLRSPWPLARLLGRLRPKAPDTENPGAAPGGLRGLQWMPLDEEQLPYTPSGSGAQIYEQSNDVTFPWVQFIARAVPPQGLFMGLPWPQGLRFTDIQREAMQLLEAFPASNYPSPSNDRQTWRTLCLVCKDGLQDPATTTEGTVYAKTEILSLAPALEKFIDLFGPTGRVRLSVVLPDGMIAWHPDARVVENGRLILHVPIQTNPRALTRVGQLLLHVPEGQLHWADFSIPHCVFNAGTQPRVHLIIDDFARNFLAHLPTAEAERFRRHALPEVALGEASAVGPPGTRFARPLSRQMSDTFGMLVGAEMLSLERRIWEQDLRIRSDTDWLRVLDGARALALLWTFALHSLLLETWDVESQKRRDLEETWDVMKRQWWAQLPLQGNTGVDAFFVLSGCLMTRSYEKLRKASKQPLWRRYAVFLLCRFFRLWPMVCVAVMASLLMGLLPCCAWSARWHSIWAHLLLVQNLDVESLKNPDLTVLWSIGTEMQIYLITPALLELLLRPTGQRRIWAFFALGCISILSTVFRFWLVFGSPDNPIERTWPPRPIYANPLSRLSPYLSGIALQLAFAERSLAPNATTVIASADSTASRAAEIPRAAMASAAVFSDVAALGVLLLSLLLGQKPEAAPSFMFDHFSQVVVKLIAILFPPIYGWALARVLFRCLTTPRGRSLPWSALQLFLASKIWRCLATLSYSAYVMQQFAVQPLARLMKELDLQWTADTSVSEAIWRYPVVLLLWTLMSCLIALPCHVIIEKPGIRLGRILSQRALGDGGAPWRPHSEGVPRAREGQRCVRSMPCSLKN